MRIQPTSSCETHALSPIMTIANPLKLYGDIRLATRFTLHSRCKKLADNAFQRQPVLARTCYGILSYSWRRLCHHPRRPRPRNGVRLPLLLLPVLPSGVRIAASKLPSATLCRLGVEYPSSLCLGVASLSVFLGLRSPSPLLSSLLLLLQRPPTAMSVSALSSSQNVIPSGSALLPVATVHHFEDDECSACPSPAEGHAHEIELDPPVKLLLMAASSRSGVVSSVLVLPLVVSPSPAAAAAAAPDLKSATVRLESSRDSLAIH